MHGIACVRIAWVAAWSPCVTHRYRMKGREHKADYVPYHGRRLSVKKISSGTGVKASYAQGLAASGSGGKIGLKSRITSENLDA